MESRALYDQPTTRYQPPSPIWRDFKTWRGSELPHGHRRWLLDQGSLTERLLAASRRRLAVEVLQQRWQRASTSEYRLLAIPHRQHCLVREVLLHCAGQPWVYARSVLPACSLRGELRHLRHFDNRPLGQLLFTTPGMQRSPFEIARMAARDLPRAARPPQQAAQKDALWGRRSRFVLYNKPLLVSEIFLPACQL